MLDYQWKKYNKTYICAKYNDVRIVDAEYALIQFNIKNFRFYNTRYGVEKGDEILEAVFKMLCSYFSDEEYVGHIEADNFAVLAKVEDVKKLAYDRLTEVVDMLYRIDDPCIYRNLFFSIGIYPIEENDSCFLESWNKVNLCRKSSKELAQLFTCVEIYDEQIHNEYLNTKELEIKVAEAYKNYEFTTYLQPKVELENETVVGAEALLRWIDKDGNSIPLYKFLPVLNENSYIVLVDLDIFDRMCGWIEARLKAKKHVVPVSFNISNAYFYDPDILNDYISIFEKYDIPKQYIQIEFMESISLNDTEHMKRIMSGFRDYGFTCLLDDFGNGFSSFNVLLNAPLDIVKMDRQFFVDNLRCEGELVIRTVVDLIHSLDMKVVAEGVEEEEHIKCLKACDCDYVQGYYYYKPMPIEEFEEILDKKE